MDAVKNQFAMSDVSQLLRDVANAVSASFDRVTQPQRMSTASVETRDMVLALLEFAPKPGHRIAQQMRLLLGEQAATTGEVFAALEALVASELATQTIDDELKCYGLTEAGQAAQSLIDQQDASDEPEGSSDEPQESSDWRAKADLARASARLVQAIGAAATSSPQTKVQARRVISKASKDLFQLLAADN